MIAKHKKKFIAIILILLLPIINGCTGNCTEADDTGQAITINVETKFTSDDEFKSLKNGESGRNPKFRQTVPWHDTELITDGRPLLFQIKGQWTSWEGTEKNRECSNFKIKQIQGQSCPKIFEEGPYQINDENGKIGAPCWFNNGFGVYILLFKNYQQYTRSKNAISSDLQLTQTEKNNKIYNLNLAMHPNATLSRIRNPIDPTFHAYSANGDKIWSQDDIIKDSNGQAIHPQFGWRVFVKVIDRYYEDNQTDDLKIIFTSGVFRGESQKRIFSQLLEKISSIFVRYAEKVFTGIAKNNQYKSIVIGSAILMITFTGIGYTIGTINISYADAIIRILKIGIVTALISPGSWGFFYRNFLTIFIDGIADLCGIVGSTISGYNPSDPFGFIDFFFFTHFFSDTMWKIKIPAMLTADFATGFAWIFIIMTIFLILMYITIYVFAIYVAGMMTISFLVGLTPLFLVFILFEPLKSLFDGWLSSLIHNALQVVMIISFMIFIFDIVKIHILKTVGFPTCNSKLITMSPCVAGCNEGICCSDILNITGHHPGSTYKPVSLFGKNSTSVEKSVTIAGKTIKAWYDKRYTIDDTMKMIPVPPDYTKKELRYINLPFLNINTEQKRISEILLQGKIIDLNEAAIVLLITIIATFMKNAVLEVGQLVGGGEIFRDNLSATFGNFSQRMASIGGKYNPFQMAYGIKFAVQDGIAKTLRLDQIHDVASKIAAPALFFTTLQTNKNKSALAKARRMVSADKSFSSEIQDALGGRIEFLGKGVDRLKPGSLVKSAFRPSKTLKELVNIRNSYKDHLDGISFLQDKSIRAQLISKSVKEKWEEIDKQALEKEKQHETSKTKTKDNTSKNELKENIKEKRDSYKEAKEINKETKEINKDDYKEKTNEDYNDKLRKEKRAKRKSSNEEIEHTTRRASLENKYETPTKETGSTQKTIEKEAKQLNDLNIENDQGKTDT